MGIVSAGWDFSLQRARQQRSPHGAARHLRQELQRHDVRHQHAERQRREDQQNDPRIMAEWIQALMRGMQGVGSERLSQGLRVKMDCGSELADPWSQSSVLRELQFLISHTVHHFALIRMILLDQGVQTPAGFGVAPSTLKHEASRAACAR